MALPNIPGFTGKKEPTPFDLVPSQGFYHGNLKTRRPLLGYQDNINENVPSVLTSLTADASYRRMINCRNDLRVKVLRGPKDKFKVHNSLEGVGRNQQSRFPKPKNNYPLLVPADSQNINVKNKLGLPK
jgi:hypothetical protein